MKKKFDYVIWVIKCVKKYGIVEISKNRKQEYKKEFDEAIKVLKREKEA